MIIQIIFALASVIAIANLTLGGSRLPPINDPVQVVADCQSLVEMKQRGELKPNEIDVRRTGTLAKEQWPASISALTPLGVSVFDDRVSILISTGGMDASYGFLIPNLKQTNYNYIGQVRYSTGVKYISRTQFQEIYYWEDIE
ncbi:MAG: hypothetical protein RBS09_08830 [Anaerolineaceae bacterium]|jgi:hypothetical protein|nr:hypothetical protein [Anaerolineaceae bacterium]